MRSQEFLQESTPQFAINSKMREQIRTNTTGGDQWESQAPKATVVQRCSMINRSIASMAAKEKCHLDDEIVDNTVDVVDVRGNQVLEATYWVCVEKDKSLLYNVHINAGYNTGQSPGFVTRMLAQIFRALEYLHGPGHRLLSVYDDRGHGVWQHIAQKLGAQYSD
jgi:hypothetical protein